MRSKPFFTRIQCQCLHRPDGLCRSSNPAAWEAVVNGQTESQAELSSPSAPPARPGSCAFAVFKRATFGPAERLGLEFRAEFFNLFNRAQFGPPDTFLPSASFGRITNKVNNPRLIQFAMKFVF